MLVLVVDDDADIAEMLARVVTYLGHTAVACANTTQAIEQFALAHFDVVIADYLMTPDDGIAVLTAFVPCNAYRVLLTASYTTVEMSEALEEGVVHDIVQKPASLADLSRVLSSAACSR